MCGETVANCANWLCRGPELKCGEILVGGILMVTVVIKRFSSVLLNPLDIWKM